MRRKWGILLFIIVLLLITINMSVYAQNVESDIYFEGDKIDKGDNFKNLNGAIYIKARFLSELLKTELTWQKSIQLLEIKKDDILMKMMVNNPYLQINDRAVKTKEGLIIENGHTYIPFKEVVRGFNYIYTEEETDSNIYVYRPEIMVNAINYNEKSNNIIVDLSNKADYEIKVMEDDPSKLLIRLKRATLSGDFLDGLSGEKYNLNINRSSEKMYLEMIIDSDSNIPFNSRNSVKESENEIIISFLPELEDVICNNNGELKIKASGEINNPEIFYLKDPRRMVIDIPSLLMNNFTHDFDENNWVKNIRISQFKYNPIVLRVVVELKDDKYLELVKDKQDNSLLFQSKGKIALSNLAVNDSVITFNTDKSMEPDIFTLDKPYRLVMDFPDSYRDENFSDITDFSDEGELIREIRTSRFDGDTVRLVAELNKSVDYNWSKKRTGNSYNHIIYLNNNIRGIEIINEKSYNEIDIELTNKVSYKVKKFTQPDRIAVDITGVDNVDKDNFDIPAVSGNISDIYFNSYDQDDEEIVRVEFTLDDYYGHSVLSGKTAKNIRVKLWKKKTEENKELDLSDLIVIDPGHGGFDPGAVGSSGLKEKTVNLKISKKIGEILKNKGYNILLTRNNDEFISLQERVKIARNKRAAIFVSIHNNSTKKSYVGGSEIFVAKNHNGEDLDLAEKINNNLVTKIKLDNRGIRKDNFYVIKNTAMPSVLVEVAFLSNSHEESLLSNDLFQEKVAEGIAKGIIEYIETQKMEADQ